LSTIRWSLRLEVKTLVKVPPVSRLVVTTVPRTLSRKYGNGDEPRWLKTKFPLTSPLSWAGMPSQS
jgi:hypothetical protein